MAVLVSGVTGKALLAQIKRGAIRAGKNIEIVSQGIGGTWLKRKVTPAGFEIITAVNNIGNVATVNVAVVGGWVAL